MTVHEGHRERLRDSFLAHGLDSFHEVQALELLLFYAVPRRDTNPLAHALLDRFGGLDGVFSATEQELCDVPGISTGTACLLRMIPQIMRKSEVERASSVVEINSIKDAADYLIPRFRYERDELLILLCLDGQRRITHVEVLSRGVVNSVLIDVRRIVEIALKRKAVSVILAHNHPDGPTRPSYEDDHATGQVYNALATMNIALYDHLVISGEDYTSYRASGALDLFRYQY